jgi:hypothetical protein
LVDAFSTTYKLAVYPNPFKGKLKIDYETIERSDVKIGLYDITGSFMKEVYNGTHQSGIQQMLIDMNEYASGIYLLKVQINRQVKTIRLLAE